MNELMQHLIHFQNAMNQPVGTLPSDRTNLDNQDICILRIKLIQEEAAELYEAIANGQIVDIADGIADLIYVAIGAAVVFGIDMAPVWDEVQKTNMAKSTGPVREDGNRLKPPGWEAPDIEGILANQKPLQLSYLDRRYEAMINPKTEVDHV